LVQSTSVIRRDKGDRPVINGSRRSLISRVIKQFTQTTLAVLIGHGPQIPSIEKQKIESIVAQLARTSAGKLSAQGIVVGDPIAALDNGFAIQHGISDTQPRSCLGDGLELRSPVVTAP
jgi:hypothetical protein